MLDLKDLQCFVAVYEQRGFVRAARQLNTVQSNVSARIRRLEREIEALLFRRLHRRIQPTAKGELMYRYATRLLSEVTEIEDEVRGRDVA